MSSSDGKSRVKKPVSGWQRPSLFLLAGGGLLLLGLLAGFYLFFPAETLKQRITQELNTRTAIDVKIEQVALYPLLSLHANQVNMTATALPRPLEIEALSVAPLWMSLLSNDPGAKLQARLMNGNVSGEFQKSGVVSVMATGLRFDLPLQKPMALTVTGVLNQATLDGSTRLDTDTQTHLSLRLSEVGVSGLEIFKADSPGLALGEIILEVDGLGRAMKIQTLSATGGDLDVSGVGSLLIGRTSASSRIKLELQVRAGANADPSITSMLELTGRPGSDGRYTLNIGGTLAKPILNSGG